MNPSTVTYVFANGNAFLQQLSAERTDRIRTAADRLFVDGSTHTRRSRTERFDNVVIDTLVRALYTDPTLAQLVATCGDVMRVIVADIPSERPSERETRVPAAFGAPYGGKPYDRMDYAEQEQVDFAAPSGSDLTPGMHVLDLRTGATAGFVDTQGNVVITDETAVLPEVAEVLMTYRFNDGRQDTFVSIPRRAEPGQTSADIDSHAQVPLRGAMVRRPTVAEAVVLTAAVDEKVTMLQTLFGPLLSVRVTSR